LLGIGTHRLILIRRLTTYVPVMKISKREKGTTLVVLLRSLNAMRKLCTMEATEFSKKSTIVSTPVDWVHLNHSVWWGWLGVIECGLSRLCYFVGLAGLSLETSTRFRLEVYPTRLLKQSTARIAIDIDDQWGRWGDLSLCIRERCNLC